RLVSPGWTGYPAVHHMLLASDAPPTRWFASHPPLAERIRRIYGRSMPVLSARHDEAVTRPDALF
ncbi:MAG: peptidase M48, partial [Rhodoferax sp.]|nr:peptidase M48 [Rhodoferax sp.]